MKIAFTTKGIEWTSMMDPRFGRTEFLLIYDEEQDKLVSYDNTAIAETAHGAGPQTVQKLVEFEPNVLITGNGPGGNAARALGSTTIEIYIGAGDMTVKAAYDAYKNNTLKKQ
ncbi:NifB/NifX family molybdenum-iron cluster-binding protein [bacterium]|nr:NifB/NifX family molybdenum-iron cluster-binding protein [bacterium]